MSYEQDLQTALDTFEKSSIKCAEVESDYKEVESQQKTKLAIAYSKTDTTGEDGKRIASSTREMQALFDPDFLQWELAVREARTKFIKWRAKKDIDEKRFEMYRSLLSLEKSRIV